MTPLEALVQLVARLRAPDGCPWDRSQTPESTRPYLLEEAFEVIDAIDSGAPAAVQAELGDLLFQVVFLAQMAKEQGQFDLDAVATAITEKMIRRHPHVFDPDHQEENPGTVGAWEARKARERGRGSMLDGVPKALPALLRAHRVGEKVARVGFDWPDVPAVRAKVDEELAELDAELLRGDRAAIAREYGDCLLALANLGRALDLGPEDALREANHRFEARFREVERLAQARDQDLHALDPAALDQLWREAKALRSQHETGG